MKLLIVDDEELTREGLISSIDWISLGITQIFQAEDGVIGLRIAKTQKPDIILCDVRMPRMDGIELIERLEVFLPDASIIFMSGYSDKEYLKAAIKLKAITYVEKPLNPLEIKEAVLEAKKQFQQKIRTHQNETLHSMETASRLALFLTRPYEVASEQIETLLDDLSLPLTFNSFFTSFIVNLNLPDLDFSISAAIQKNLSNFLNHYQMHTFYVVKHTHYQVFHILSSSRPDTLILTEIGRFLMEQYNSLGSFSIAIGDPMNGVTKAYQSYISAVALLQNGFFFDSGHLLISKNKDSEVKYLPIELPTNPVVTFSKSLLARDSSSCFYFLEQLFSFYYKNRSAFSNQVKDLYYKLFITVQESRQKLKLSPDLDVTEHSETLTEYLSSCFTFKELHSRLVAQTKQFFKSLQTYEPEDSTIFLIKDYISTHYSKESLSVKDIGEHVFLSASYVCTYFKNETGQTLNQYLTECRMEKAKQLLSDPKYQITDISSKIGYSNGNYFSKSFKKSVGLSPSEYREKMLR